MSKQKTKRTCNQCFKQILPAYYYYYGEKKVKVGFCNNPRCPNYGLVQIPIESMPNKKVEK
jgi:hypothetical protein